MQRVGVFVPPRMPTAARVRGVLGFALLWPVLAGAGVLVSAHPRAGLALAGLFLAITFIVVAANDLALPRLALFVALSGLLFANKSFADIGFGSVYIMDVLLAGAVVGAIANPQGLARLAAARVPLATLGLFLLLGVIALVRGRGWGVLAVKDSVVNFYAIGVIVPAALFGSIDRAWSFMRLLLPALLVGSLFSAVGMIEANFGSGLPTSSFVFTPATATALSAVGALFLVLSPGRVTSGRVTSVAVLAGTVIVGLARSVWAGAIVSAASMWAAAARDRQRLATVATVSVLVLMVGIVMLSVRDARILPVLGGKIVSFVFKESSATPGPVADNRWRLKVWGATFHDRIAKNPILGEGFGAPAVAGTEAGKSLDVTDERVQVHNVYLTYLMREGIVGLLAFFALVLPAVYRAARCARRLNDDRERLFSLAVLGGICLYLVDAGFGVILEGPMGGIPFWLLIGLAYTLPARPGRQAVAPEGASLD